MRAIVTGGAGFIGSHLAGLLLEKGHEVIVLDDLSSGDQENIPPGADFRVFDISDGRLKDALGKDLEEDYVDWVFHLAGKASIVPSIRNPETYHDVNVTGTLKVLQLARILNAKKFIYAASGSCYGIPDEIPTSENCRVNPMYPYALTKYIAEQYIIHWSKVYGLPYVSLRLFNVFGPRMCLSGGYGGLFSTILAQKFNNQPVITIGNGEQRRDFVYVTDAAKAFLVAAESNIANEVFNIGQGDSVSVNRILRLLGIEEESVKRLPDRPGEPKETLALIQKAKRMLGWEPKISFKDGLALMTANANYWKAGRVWTWDESVKSQEDWYQYLGHKIK